jgi:hypothetical protein
MFVLVTLAAVAGSASLQAGEKGKAKGKTKALRGEFLFAHPAPDGPLFPGDEFFVEGDFVGWSTHVGCFAGSGDALGEVLLPEDIYPSPDGPVLATYTGNFTWTKPSGTLSGTFFGIDVPLDPPLDPNNPLLPVFKTIIILTIEGGTGRFDGASGEITAIGIDDPYGLALIGGVLCEFEGTLVLAK